MNSYRKTKTPIYLRWGADVDNVISRIDKPWLRGEERRVMPRNVAKLGS